MIRYLAVLCLIAPAFGGFFFPKWEKGLRARFGVNAPFMEPTAFLPLPQTESEAVSKGWAKQTTKPDGPQGFESLSLYCQLGAKSLCMYYDAEGVVAGVLIAVDEKQTQDVKYSFEDQGCWRWTVVEDDGIPNEYWTISIIFGSPEFYAQDSIARNAQRDNSKIPQGANIYVTANHQELKPISTNPEIIANTALSNFTEQACMIGMGHHYYYKMTPDLPCDGNLLKFFPLVYDGQFIGLGTMVLTGKLNLNPKSTVYFENPPQLAVKAIVPRGPQCLYDDAKSPGIVTMHLYFIDSPSDILCAGESYIG